MKKINLIIFSLLFCSVINAATLIEAIGDKNTQFEGGDADVFEESKSQVHLYNLNGPDEINKLLGDKLPPNKEQAMAIVKSRIAVLGPSLEVKTKTAYLGITAAIRYRLTEYPAIVFNQKYVIYGETDIEAAYNQYQAWLDKHE
ncbi:TIGR03757 family integrating conjugative element protein [Endozoicomonas sp. SM1973]|uniref:TIGR03757 family integrating conjugative element protein n=1 Tax=Spartinivicinus marinus TaxID=2994442 RepID=A0A853IE84_9GAMM|nr:TIGR03757 family integrating conjugative element protein [Spartinivicinus marinus]MCX4030174.1 TIGR03757 family integrating conjugative element protein [Spartinivicinus marinus]NYZ67817.1 TIGR03757 family integrating conjugative element protein [Spartinivicinus marinus]